MAIPVSRLKGMNSSIGNALKDQGITNAGRLLEAARGPAERELLELANRADPSRVKGGAGVFSDLLEKAGVDTVKVLTARRPDNLHARIVEVNNAEKLAGRVPTASDVEEWVSQAKVLPRDAHVLTNAVRNATAQAVSMNAFNSAYHRQMISSE